MDKWMGKELSHGQKNKNSGEGEWSLKGEGLQEKGD